MKAATVTTTNIAHHTLSKPWKRRGSVSCRRKRPISVNYLQDCYSVDSVPKLNDHALALLLSNHAPQAIECWERALNILLSAAAADDDCNHHSNHNKTAQSILRRMAGPCLMDPQQSISPDGAFCFFRHLFVMIPNHQQTASSVAVNDDDDEDNTSLSSSQSSSSSRQSSSSSFARLRSWRAVVLYHLAYAHHQQGRPLAAIRYYQQSLQCKTCHKGLALASLNNMGHAHSSLFHNRPAASCRALLWKKRRELYALAPPGEYCLAFQELQCAPVA